MCSQALPLLRPAPPQPEATVSQEESKEESAIAMEDGDEEKSGGDEIVRGNEEGVDVIAAADADSMAVVVEVEMDEAAGPESAGSEYLPTEPISTEPVPVADSATFGTDVAHSDSSSSSNPLPVEDDSASPPGDIVSEVIVAVDDPTTGSSIGILPIADADPQVFVLESIVVVEAEDTAVTMQ